MVLSERDAKFKYCPLLKTMDDKLKFCLVSSCMMWSWTDESKGEGCCGLAGSAVMLDRQHKPGKREED